MTKSSQGLRKENRALNQQIPRTPVQTQAHDFDFVAFCAQKHFYYWSENENPPDATTIS